MINISGMNYIASQTRVAVKLRLKWGKILSQAYGLSVSECADMVYRLQHAYRHSSSDQCLQIINSLPFMPGYPYLQERPFEHFIGYICQYFERAQHHGLPHVPFFAFDKSGSAYIATVLGKLFHVSPTVMTFKHAKAIPAWVTWFKQCGGVLHDHYPPTPENLALLYQHDFTKCIVHDREPVGKLISVAHHWFKNDALVANKERLNRDEKISIIRDYLDREMEFLVRDHSTKRKIWHHEAKLGRMEIVFTHYEDMKRNSHAFFHTLLQHLQIPYDVARLTSILQMTEAEKAAKQFNFRKAYDEEWREVLTPQLATRLNRLLAEEFPEQELLDLQGLIHFDHTDRY